MTSDHWGFVLSAYGIAAITLGVYWRHLCRRDRELAEQRSHAAPKAGHPRTKPLGSVQR